MEMATHSSILAWRIPWTEEHAHTHTYTHTHPPSLQQTHTPVYLPTELQVVVLKA